MTRLALTIAAATLLAGCADMPTIAEVFGRKPAPPPAETPLYCYQTLAKVDCHAQPLPARGADRLVGYYGPPPRATSGTGPLRP